MIEVAMVFDSRGEPFFWHLPPGRSGGAIPDSRDLWEVLWEHRDDLGGIAHTHPWYGESGPSNTDVTTFAAVEAALGKRLLWLVVTFDHVTYLEWAGPGRHDYGQPRCRRFRVGGIEKLRQLSGKNSKEEQDGHSV